MKSHLFLLVLLSGLAGMHLTAQPSITLNLQQFINYSGSFEDFLVPAGATTLTIEATGGDGGNALVSGGLGCAAPGGVGAKINAVFNVGQEAGKIPPCSVIRFIAGGRGESLSSQEIAGAAASAGAGGGGSAVLLRAPGESAFTVLLVAGGGGGGYQGVIAGACIDHRPGQGGSATTAGGNGSAAVTPGTGGTNGNGGGSAFAAGGGGGVFTAGGNLECPGGSPILGGQAGQQTGGAGGAGSGCQFLSISFFKNGGFGFGGGGGIVVGGFIIGASAGGGGGFSGGGAGGFIGGGGGGGSFVNTTFTTQFSITPGGSSFSNNNGGISYIANGLPTSFSIFCKSHTVVLNEGNFASIISDNVLSEIVTNCEGLGPISLSQSFFDCDDIGINIIQVTATNTNNTSIATCLTPVTVVDNTPPTIACPTDQILALDTNCSALLPDYTSLALAADNCAIAAVEQSPLPGTPVSGSGSLTVTLRAVDRDNKTASCSFQVIKKDTSPPVVNCANQTLTFNGQNSFTLNPNALATVQDNCGVQSLSLAPNVLTCAELGQTIPVTATATDINGNTATCISQITLTGLPCNFNQQPNGVNCSNGNAVSFDPVKQLFTLTSTNCYYDNPFTSDAMAFVQRQLCGDGSITAQVVSITGASFGWAGLVMRENNSAGAKKIQLTINRNSNLCRREARYAANASAYPQQSAAMNRFWLRLVRQGNQFSAFTSSNGVQWNLVMATTISMANCIEIGLMATNYQPNSTVTASFDQVAVTGNNTNLIGNSNSLSASEDGNVRANDYLPLQVFPNPSTGLVTVDLSGYGSSNALLEVFDSRGVLLNSKAIYPEEFSTENLDLSAYPSGIYLIRIRQHGAVGKMKRLALQR